LYFSNIQNKFLIVVFSLFFSRYIIIVAVINRQQFMIQPILFILCLLVATYIFVKKIQNIRRNILLGKDKQLNDRKKERWLVTLKVAFGQSKMMKRPIVGLMHFFIYAGFLLINIEVLEIIIDGISGSHRVFMDPLGNLYTVAIAFFEIVGLLVIISCVLFLIRRDILKIPRLNMKELEGFPKKDAHYILYIELVLMTAIMIMNAVDGTLSSSAKPISQFLVPIFSGIETHTLHSIERIAWWIHALGILAFLNYLPYSKHFHIILAFPNTFYSKLEPMGKMENLTSVITEVNLMMDPSAAPPEGYEPPTSFGVKDVNDLTWKNLLDAYSCTECGRCTSVCPANITGKLLSPRKIMMATRDRIEEVGKAIDQKIEVNHDEKNLHTYISEEELWACTTCNACAEACPINIDPVDIISGMRQYLVMEKSAAPTELNNMFGNIENNGAPWQFSPSDRGNWKEN